jgi:hypothetical protein
MVNIVDDIATIAGDPDLGPRRKAHSYSKAPDLRGKTHEEAVEAMKAWFFDNFEDPAENKPWDDGEYVFIWGGPCYAEKELGEAFDGIASGEDIAAAVVEIENEGCEWVPIRDQVDEEEMPDEVVDAKRGEFDTLRARNDVQLANSLDHKRVEDSAKVEVLVSDLIILLRELRRLAAS